MYTVFIEKKYHDWLPETRWLECFVGEIWSDWDDETTDDGVIYYFKRQQDAEAFNNLWGKQCFPYHVWSEFFLNDLTRNRINRQWQNVGWFPSFVITSARKNVQLLPGGRKHYKNSYKSWFFEYWKDAVAFLMSV